MSSLTAYTKTLPLQYLDDFSRALATEVRMLLGEVGRIREERRALQQCDYSFIPFLSIH